MALMSALSLALACAVVGLWLQGRHLRRALGARLDTAHSRLSELRQRDPLTGLLTRSEFDTQMESLAFAADRDRGKLALLYVGLDNFRAVNEGYGPRVGDALLVEVAKRLTAIAAPDGLAARVSGDEFVVLLPGEQDDAPEGASRAQALKQALAQDFCVEAMLLQVSTSIGLAAYPDDGARTRLMAHAALAMRSVKHGGGAGHAHYNPAMGANTRDQAELLQDLRLAVARHELQLYYQPKVDAASLQVGAAEALLRWQHPKRGMVSPTVFVPLAERHGLIVGIGQWVIEEACRQAAQWRESGLRMRLAVNISGHQLRRAEFVDEIEDSLRRHQIPPGRLTCEITETVAMEDTTVTRQAFERLRQAGLHVSIDDFGTGHSSLAALRRLPAAELKIDRAFVTDLENSEDARSIVRAVIQMAHSLQLRVVAEGVETEAQRDQLVQMGCDELQGYLFAKPMTARMLALWASGEGSIAGSMFRPSLFDPTAHAPL